MSAENSDKLSGEKSILSKQKGYLKESIDHGTNVAVVSEPYGGRADLLDDIASYAKSTEHVSFSSVEDAEDKELPQEADVCLVDGCRYLYTRRIDGLEPLERFIDTVAASETTFVASWNSYAWSYAKHATDVDDVIAEEVSLPELSTVRLANLLASEYDVSEFESDLKEIREEGKTVLDRLPERFRFGLAERSDNIFKKIAALSGGNPGVARAVFESRLWEEKEEEEDEIGMSYEDAFALHVILSKENVPRDVVDGVVYPRSLEKTLRKLSDHGFIELDGDQISLRPERLVKAVSHLERRRLVW